MLTWEQLDLKTRFKVFSDDKIPQNLNRMDLSNSQQARCRLLIKGLGQHSGDGALPALCSTIGAVANGTDFRSKGFSEGSRVYWCRALSRPGMDTVKPGDRRDRSLEAQPTPALRGVLKQEVSAGLFEDLLYYRSGCSQH